MKQLVRAIIIFAAIFVTGGQTAWAEESNNNPLVEIATWSGFRKGATSFTFDDGAPSHVSDAGPVFKKYGYKATFCLVTGWNPYWSGFQALADEGHEIASHSNSHGENMSGEEASSKKIIEGKIKQKYGVITVAYPNGNVSSVSTVLQNYIVGRIFNGSWVGMDTFLVTRIGCGIAGFTDDEISPLFENAHDVENIVLPPGW